MAAADLGGRAKPKVLLTGKPLGGQASTGPGKIDVGHRHGRESGLTVDDIVRDPAHDYVAAIGGDTHNYQRYPVRVGERTIQYIVSGGGGALPGATHTIPRSGRPRSTSARRRRTSASLSEDFRCYPLRGDSLACLPPDGTVPVQAARLSCSSRPRRPCFLST